MFDTTSKSSRPSKPSKAQLKQQARLLEHSLFTPSAPVDLRRFISQLGPPPPAQPFHSNQHLQLACTLADLIQPLEPIYRDSNLLSELRDHQHELATPHGSLHALHAAESHEPSSTAPPADPASLPPAAKKARLLLDRSSDIPVDIRPDSGLPQTSQRATPIPDYLDPSLFACSASADSPASASSSQLLLDDNSQKPKRIRKKAAGPPQSITHKPKPIQDLINRLSSTGLKILQPHFDGMWYVRSVGRSDWNTSTQPMHSNLPHPAPEPDDPQPVMITITFHPFSKTSTTQESSEAKSIAPRKQTIHILSSQKLSDLRDVVVCSANQIPICSDDGHWDDQRWISGSAFIIENVLFADTRPLSPPEEPSRKSDYGILLQELLPNLIEKGKVENLLTIEEDQGRNRPEGPEEEQEIQELEGMNGPKLQPKSKTTSKIKVSSLSMECVRFDQLTLRINEPYWMIHQGNCEHIFTVDEIRAIHPTDPAPGPTPSVQASQAKPPLARAEEIHPDGSSTSGCRVCDRDPARLVTIDDELCAESPCFICLTCFKFLHAHEDIFDLDPSPTADLAPPSLPVSLDPSLPADPGHPTLNHLDHKIRWGKVQGRSCSHAAVVSPHGVHEKKTHTKRDAQPSASLRQEEILIIIDVAKLLFETSLRAKPNSPPDEMVPAALFQKDSLNQKNYEYHQILREMPESSRLRSSKICNPVIPRYSSSDPSNPTHLSLDHHPKTRYSPRTFSSKSAGQDHHSYQHGEKLSTIRNEENAPPVGLFGKLRQLTKLYGSAALVIYGLIGGIDFGLAFLTIYLVGAEHVKKVEDWLLERISWKWAHSIASRSATSASAGSGIDNNMLWTTTLVAYTIHKTILLPFRILLTAWITPPIVRHLRKRGWKVGRNLE
ncbi:hypothetical protein PtA15_12A435 [Puccinia triticina]|nr:uncharacterized protein PtA15_12A435 [Puccinia triticina]WAQ90446.1 hypothetical protein PtA15_12A435 [Puccinia triticina]